MPCEILVHIALLLVGIGFMVFAIIRLPQRGPPVIDVRAEKLGLSLKANAFALVVLLGFALTGSGIFFLYHDIKNGSDGPPPYPPHGLIANFSSGPGGFARTAEGEQISAMLDSAWGKHSTIWYERVEEANREEGYLRVHYRLVPDGQPPSSAFVGIYANFTSPIRPFDVSAFIGLQLRVRGSNAVRTDSVRISVGLADEYPLEVRGGDNRYAFPTYVISPLPETWRPITIAFSDLRTPRWPGRMWPFNRRRVFRFFIVIEALDEADVGRTLDGLFDIDDIQFFPAR